MAYFLKRGLHNVGQLTVVTGRDDFRLTSLKKSGYNYASA